MINLILKITRFNIYYDKLVKIKRAKINNIGIDRLNKLL